MIFLSLVYEFFVCNKHRIPMMPPSIKHWCGTGLYGEDIFSETIEASVIEVLILLIVSALVWSLGIVLGAISSIPNNRFIRETIMSFIHVIATLPILLLALFLLILFGGGIVNAILILVISTLPSQILYAYNQFEQAKKEDFYFTKQSYGLSKIYIYKNHLSPFIIEKYNQYTLSRLPEIMMMSLAINYLGLGVKTPIPSLGRMLYDGLSFMFSAWWIWMLPVGSVVFTFFILSVIANNKNERFKTNY